MRSAAFRPFFCLTALGILATAGCATRAQSKPQPRAAAATAPKPRTVGEIAIVDEEKHFVLIDLQSNLYVPAAGVELRALGANGAISRLKASPEQNRPFIAADIVEGEPAVGDEVVK